MFDKEFHTRKLAHLYWEIKDEIGREYHVNMSNDGRVNWKDARLWIDGYIEEARIYQEDRYAR